jgi:hypothetical protein
MVPPFFRDSAASLINDVMTGGGHSATTFAACSNLPIFRISNATPSADGAGPIKHGEFPSAGHHVVSQDVAGAIVAADLEVPMIRRQPCVEYFNDLDASAMKREPPRWPA